MNSWNYTSLKSVLVPGSLLLIGITLLLHLSFVSISLASINFYYLAAFGSGLLLSWRFHSTRVFFILLVMVLAERAVSFFGHPAAAPPARMAFAAVSFLLPLNFVVFALLRERGFTTSAVACRLFLIFLQSVFVALECRPDHASGSSLLMSSLGTTKWFEWTSLPQPALLAFGLGFGVLLARFAVYGKATESGSLWSLLALGIALNSGFTGRTATAYLGTAGLILAAAVVETSYFMAYHDELTKLPGRRAFNELLLGLEDRYAIAIVDVDHFKKFNDTYGHETGDQVLRMVAAKLQEVTGGGKAFRCGGEEFAIVFPGVSARDAWEHVDLLRQSIGTSSFRVRGQLDRRKVPRPGERREGARVRKISVQAGDEVSVTVSIGVAEPSTRNRKVDQVIAAADEALYRAKAGGRNRVELDGMVGKQLRLSKGQGG